MSLHGKKIIVFGAAGRLGKELVPMLVNAGATVYAPPRKEVDITFDVWYYIFEKKADIVVNLVAFTNVSKAQKEEHRAECAKLNIIGSRCVAVASHALAAKVVYISTDYVYPGVDGDYSVGMEFPSTNYGMTKLIGEWFCDPTRDLVIRTSFKSRGTWGPNALTKVFHPVYTNADWADVIAKKVVIAMENDLVGTHNIGTATKTLLDLARQDYHDVDVVDVKRANVGYEYPCNCTMVIGD